MYLKTWFLKSQLIKRLDNVGQKLLFSGVNYQKRLTYAVKSNVTHITFFTIIDYH